MLVALIRQNLRHIVRTKLLLVLILFSFLIQFVGLKTLHSVIFRYQGIVRELGTSDSLFIALIFQLFTGAFVSAAYGIWMVPYAHQGPRSSLTFTLPVPRWYFPVAYAVSMLVLLLLQHVVLLVSFGLTFGMGVFSAEAFPWSGFLIGLALETMAFEMLLFAFAVSSMVLGQIPTFFAGALMIFVLQLSGAVLRIDFEALIDKVPPKLTWAQRIYSHLPPVGELIFDLQRVFRKATWEGGHFLEWGLWLLAFGLLFRWKLRFPQRSRPGEI